MTNGADAIRSDALVLSEVRLIRVEYSQVAGRVYVDGHVVTDQLMTVVVPRVGHWRVGVRQSRSVERGWSRKLDSDAQRRRDELGALCDSVTKISINQPINQSINQSINQ